MKKLFTLSVMLLAGSILITSCNRTVTPRKLDGDWTVTSGERSASTSSTDDGTTYTSSMNASFNGSAWTTTSTSGGISETTTSSMTIDYSFDRGTGEYSSVEVMTDPNYSELQFLLVYDDADGNFDFTEPQYVDRMTSRTATTTEEGLFTITGNAGDAIEKNSQIVFQRRLLTETYTDTYTYTNNGTNTTANLAGKFWYDFIEGEYVPFPTTASATETTEGETSGGLVWNVVELSGGEMTVEFTDNFTTTELGSLDSYAYTSNGSFTLEEK